ncbi:unnamed protein product [Phytophthora fragariaefolia]|uniref:Unnamed protein product n=1 Tax=Phytophthora fragariaefolia TaxID=1490495 RepID=A0A9W7D898_9STRA|nr:unnamed protein product [Phytophthora fragariaefolia]
MILVKEYEVADRKHLRAYEQIRIAKFWKTAVNEHNGFKINRFSHKQHYENNKIEHCEKMKQYRRENSESVSAYNRKYYEENKDKLRAKEKLRLQTRFDCECGGKYSLSSKSNHFKTQKHQKWHHAQN